MLQAALVEQGIDAYMQEQYLLEEWDKFHKWARESRSLKPFIYLALDWHAGHLTIDEGKRLERAQHIAQFLSQ